MRVLTEKQREMARERYRKWISKEENRAKERARLAALRIRDKEKLAERQRVWRESNPERLREIRAAWQKRNPEKVKANGDHWRKENPDRVKDIQARAHAKLRACPDYTERRRRWRANRKDSPLFKAERRRGHILRKARLRNAKCEGVVDLTAIQERCQGHCGICGHLIDGAFHYDHIIPIAKGGAHSTENLQMAHPLCNVRKKDKISTPNNTNAATGVYLTLLYN